MNGLAQSSATALSQSLFWDSSRILLIVVLVAIVCITFWLLFRELLTWYWKINKIVSTLEEISSNLKILTTDKRIEQSSQITEVSNSISLADSNKTTKQ